MSRLIRKSGTEASAAARVDRGDDSVILRYGALRMTEVALVLLGRSGHRGERGLRWVRATALIGGGRRSRLNSGELTVAGRVSTTRLAPLVFWIEQTAVPVGC